MRAVGEALSLLANIVMAWNTDQMQAALDHWSARRTTAVSPELIGRVAPTRTEGINFRGVFRFPIDNADRLMPSAAEATTPSRLATNPSKHVPHVVSRNSRLFIHLGLARDLSNPDASPSGSCCGLRCKESFPLFMREALAIRPQKSFGKTLLFYRDFWHRKQGDPNDRSWLGPPGG